MSDFGSEVSSEEEDSLFEAAAAYLAGAVLTGSNAVFTDAVKLKFYGLYKQATAGKCDVSKPGIFNLSGRAKW